MLITCYFVLFFVEYACLLTLSKILSANNDRRTVVKHQIEPPIKAVALRFHPTAWSGDMCMRVEAFGCDGEYIVYTLWCTALCTL